MFLRKLNLRILLAVAAAGIFAATSVRAVTILPGEVLPDAVSYEYFGLNFAMNQRSSNVVGTLDYSGQPGCGGTCKATTALGTDPMATVTVNEITYEATAGGFAQVDLGYFVSYLNAPGTYTIDLHALDAFDITDGVYAFTHLKIGPASDDTARFNNFNATTFEETHCFNGCPSSVPAGATFTPFPADNMIQLQANTLYFVQLDAVIQAGATNVADTATIDPTFSANSGGSFVFSPGVLNSAPVGGVPEPESWAMMLGGFGLIGFEKRRRRMNVAGIRLVTGLARSDRL